MILLFLSCFFGEPESISFELKLNKKSFSCSEAVEGWTLTDFRFFVSNILINGNAASLVADNLWQTNRVALLDFEDGTGSCSNGDSKINTHIKISKHIKTGDVLEFDIGVPFDQNHANPVKANGPLRNMSMHWSWRTGYKFIRFGAKNLEGESLNVHLGSTGCVGEMTDVEHCIYPNRAKVKLNVVDPQKAILIHMDRFLFAPRDLADLRWGCMSERDDVGCEPVFKALGLGKDQDGVTQKEVFLQ